MESKKPKILTPANFLTFIRIIGAALMFFVEPLSALFYTVYTLSGFTDMFDGFVARVTHTESDFGAKLDSVADLLFYSCLVIRIFPKLWSILPVSIWIFLGVILLVRVVSYSCVFVKFKRFASVHTYLNKLTGMMVFLIPFSILIEIATPYCWTAAAVGFVASCEELLIHLTSKEYTTEKKTLLMTVHKAKKA